MSNLSDLVGGKAADQEYNNTTSGLAANTTQGAIDEVDSNVDAAETNIGTLQGQMTTANSNIGTLQGQMTTANSNIGTLQSDVGTLQSDVGTLQDQVIDIDSVIKTANFNATPQTIYFVDYVNAASPAPDVGVIMTLPNTATAGDRVIVYDYSNNFGVYNFQVAVQFGGRINSTINGYALAVTNGAWVDCIYVNNTEGWKVNIHESLTQSKTFYWKDNSTFNSPVTSGTVYFIDTSWPSSGIAHLPASPTAGDWVEFVDPSNFYGTGNLTIYHNNNNIEGSLTNVVLNRNGLRAKFYYTGVAAIGWVYTLSKNVITLGADTTGDFVQNVTVSGSGISIDETSGESSTPTITLASASSNTVSTLVYRDSSGNFAANDVTVNSLTASNGITLDKASGEGIKVDTASPTFGWRDLLSNIIKEEGGPNAPTFVIFRDNIKQHQFALNDEVFLEFHLPHDYVPASDLYIHVHWAHNSATVSSGSVTWSFEVTYAKGYDQAAFPATVTVTAPQTASTTQYQHMIAETQLSNNGGTGGLMDSNLLEVDGLILVRVYLSANTISTATDPFLLFCDIHYQSTGIATKNKSPNFYS